jgi:hypothetical protein
MRYEEKQEIMRQATRAGIHRESIGENMNAAIILHRTGKLEMASDAAKRIIEINNTFGKQLPESYGTNEANIEKAMSFIID